ncbi:DUF3696 domain-containing protein [Vibrio scophthalmi]|uniref:DUF3696 domain-containing protein n=1 Tax=Vibrio scophthalmi TaxID=45658 RepID=UPI0022841B0E|nr:DUF3696 domain-containing protein [Vibrio scophthalmi]MCY9805357.1 DUF3696 domain-containing protein [Vibrio scophthalmi]
MINKFSICNFKSFKYVTFDLKPLTVLSGINGSGKSTLCQAMLLMRQHFVNAFGEKDSISLNSDYVQLGSIQDIWHHGANDENIAFVAENNDSRFTYSVQVNNDNLTSDFIQGKAELQVNPDRTEDKLIQRSLRDIKYLTAERVGPRAVQLKNDHMVRVEKHVGIAGEYTNSFLDLHGSEILDLGYRSHLDSPSESLNSQSVYWLKSICQNINLNTTSHQEIDQVSISFQFDTSLGKSNNLRPTNVGFGISYVMPVIVSCLTAKPGDILIIDTPEAHLHPKGQFMMGELIACTAADGVQVIVETHSDHVINGIRVQTIKEVLEPDDSQFYYFELGAGLEYDSPVTLVHNPKINSSGQFDHWPRGFFDEWSYALNEMLKLRADLPSDVPHSVQEKE